MWIACLRNRENTIDMGYLLVKEMTADFDTLIILFLGD